MKLNLEPLNSELNEVDEVESFTPLLSKPEEIFYPENRALARRTGWKRKAVKGLLLLLFTLFYLALLYGYVQLREESLQQDWQVLLESMPK
ncbi:MAG: hypothetical protein Q9N68_12680 [Gammaproteobacteria bacterium]|nr:hypothetical protein [Gammaproteobacteria bacterium]